MILRYELDTAYSDCGEKRHPQDVIDELSKKLKFSILEATPQSIGDCWIFKIDLVLKKEDLPKYLVDITSIIQEIENEKKAGKTLGIEIVSLAMNDEKMVQCEQD